MAMSERIPLTRLLADDDATRVVAWQDGNAVPLSAFRTRVGGWRARFAAATGDRVALYFEDSVEFAAALFGAWHAGKQAWLPGDLLPATRARLARDVGSIVGDADCVALPMPSSDDWTALDPRVASLVVYTSGSSGEPVAIEKKLQQLDDEVAGLEQRFGAQLGLASVHGTVSHQHIYGLLFRVLWPLSARRVFHSRRLATPAQIAAMPGSLPVVLVASPALLKRLPPATEWRATGSDLPAVFSSGGPLPAEASDDVANWWGQRPIEIFGSTETGGIASRRGSESAWEPLPAVEWRIADDRLEIRSPHLPDNDWFATSDRVEPASAGFRLCGRSDRIVKIEERRISLTAIEQHLLASPSVREARVVLLPGERSVIAAVVVPTEAGRQQLAAFRKQGFAQDLRHALSAGIDAIAVPRRWRFVDALPVDPQGKSTEALARSLFAPTAPTPVWRQRDAVSARIELDVDGALRPFDGHFPTTPVLPGVALLDWAIRLGREAFSPPPRLLRTEVLKFQQLVRPGARLALALEWREETHTISFGFSSAVGAHASGRLVFGDGAGG